MKKNCIFVLSILVSLVLFSLTCTSFAQAAAHTLTLIPGQQKTIDAPDMNRIAVGNPGIADVKALEGAKQVLVTAMGVGQTDIIIWNANNKQRSIKVYVFQDDPRVVAKEVNLLLEGVEGIQIKALASRVIIDGKALKKEDLYKINEIAKLYPQVTNLATLSPVVIDTIINYINQEFKEAELGKVMAERLGNQIVVQGEVPNPDAKKKIELIASAFDVSVKNFVKVGVTLEKMILVNVDFIEIDKNWMNQTGIAWGDTIGVGGQIEGSANFGRDAESSAFNGSYALDAEYSAVIHMLNNNKNARILARPKLLCRNREAAEFLAGGEYPIRTATLSTFSVDYKKYGIILNIAPVADNNHNIATSIEVENSTINDYVDGQPSFQSSRVKTHINVKSGQVIVLSGLVSNEQAKAVDKVPLLGHIPILGELFKSRAFQNNESELLIFVTPELISPADAKNVKMIQGSKDRLKASEDDVSFKLLD
jgi:pilus assembly protein CpaC